ncbi:Pkinase-domain-containing protein [Hesseltinella vesiculosa]|uniref:non-specific serine/threonine protein kinase n=1 Tax=Hesseltinella vesiculosa TaxID=101127 RepID=A0A1X2GFD3_9FUNG|nr:Pkinase-domain-containing protein [Hesseltinella vesiculosa]
MGFLQTILHKSKNKPIDRDLPKPTSAINLPPAVESTVLPPKEVMPVTNKESTSATVSVPEPGHISVAPTPSSVASSSNVSSPLQRQPSACNGKRFQQLPDGTHVHHLTMPAPNRLTGLVEGLLNRERSFRFHWGEKKTTPQEMDAALKEERAVVDATLQRMPSNSSLAQKWGACQEVIGRGAFGVVRVAHKSADAEQGERLYAVKEFRKRSSESPKAYVKRLTSEFCIASTLHHMNVIETLDLLPLTETSPIYCQVMEYCDGGDLFNLVYECSDRGLEVPEANCLFKQLISGVDYLHSMGIAHRDLKPENLLMTSQGRMKISDFGSAECFRVSWDEPTMHLSKGLVGSEPYIAPEEFTQEEYDARKVDIWSCAVIYMAMRTGSHLWHIAKQGDDEAFDRYLKFRRLVDEERENTRRERRLRRQQLQEQGLVVDNVTLEKEHSVLKARETIKRKAKEGGYDVLDTIDFAAKKLIYRMLDPSPEKRVLTPDIVKNEWFIRNFNCQAS